MGSHELKARRLHIIFRYFKVRHKTAASRRVLLYYASYDDEILQVLTAFCHRLLVSTLIQPKA